jgi:hypothetical protein
VRTRAKSLAFELLPLSLWLFAPVLSSQITPALGRLHITSVPQGANITINGNRRPELTDVTLVVSPGEYAVSVTGGSGNLNCPAKQKYQVSPGQTIEVACPER